MARISILILYEPPDPERKIPPMGLPGILLPELI